MLATMSQGPALRGTQVKTKLLPTPGQKRRPIRAPPGVLQLTPRSLQIQKRVLPDRQARRTSQLVISKTLQVEDKDDDAYIRDLERKHPYPPPKASSSETVGKGAQKRKISPLSQEASATDSGENSSDKDSETTTPMQGKPKTNSLVQQAIQNPNPTTKLTDVVEPYILQHGPPTASARTLYELFARICTWSYKEKLTKCAFCELESSHDDRKRVVDIDFYALTDAVKFWHHCHEEHSAYWRPDLQSVLYGPQGLVRSVTGLPVSESSPPANRDEKIREIVACFTKLSTWVSKEGEIVCGLCELENTHSDRPPFPTLSFDPYRQPDLFWGHCRTSHPLFWRPEVRNSVELVPSFLRSQHSELVSL